MIDGIDEGLIKRMRALEEEIKGLKRMPLPARYVINVRDYGATGDGTTDDTAAIQAAIAAAQGAGGGTMYVPMGTYVANVDLSALTYPVVLRGDGQMASVITATSGIVLDVSSTSRIMVSDIGIFADGADIGILAARYTTVAGGGGGQNFTNVRVTGAPAIAGVWCLGNETDLFQFCTINTTSAASSLMISNTPKYSTSNLTYSSPNGTIVSPVSMSVLEFMHCKFLKDDSSSTITGSVVELSGTSLADISFEHCYLHGVNGYHTMNFESHGQAGAWYSISVRHCDFEANYVEDGEGNTAIGSTLSGGGSLQFIELQIVDNYFVQQIETSGYYTIDLGTAASSMKNSRISGNRDTRGGGIYLSTVRESHIEWAGSFQSGGVKAAITATDTLFYVTKRSSSANHQLYAGKKVMVGQDARYDGHTSTTGELVTVDSVVAGDPNDTINITGTFTYSHPINDSYYIGHIQIGSYTHQCTFVSFAKPQYDSANTDLGSIYIIQAFERNYRIYYGPATSTYKQSPVLVNRSFGDEPGEPETGMLAGLTAGGAWTTTTDLDNWERTNLPAWYNGTDWQVMLQGAKGMIASQTINSGSAIANDTTYTHATTVSVPNAAVGDLVVVSLNITTQGCVLWGEVTSAGTVTVYITNNTGGNVTFSLSSYRFRVIVIKP